MELFKRKGPKLKVGFQTFGCRSNYADTVELQAALADHGACPSSIDEDADVYIVNTCTVTDNADKEAYRLLRKLRERSPDAKIIVTGCMAEVDAVKIESTGLVDSIVGPGNKEEVINNVLGRSIKPETITEEIVNLPRKARLAAKKSISLQRPISNAIQGPGTFLGEVKNRSRFHLRVQEGCENHCTFCIIPESRGGYSSRPKEAILGDLKHLESVGYEEIIISGTHLGGYGYDTGSSFFELLKLIRDAEPEARVRISSIDPDDLSPEIIDFIAKNHIFCEHLHICVQAFSDPILKRMRRKHNLADVLDIVRYIETAMPKCGLGADVITGFPGESRDNVDQAMEEFFELPFSYLHVFPYSEREGTAATMLDGVVEQTERKRRAARFRSLAEKKKQSFAESLIGNQIEIIAEKIEEDVVYGTSREYVSCSFKTSNLPKIGKRFVANATNYDKTRGLLVCQ